MADRAGTPGASATEPFKHVIETYVHRRQEVTCTCGWQGSSASPDGQNSPWKSHLLEVRGPSKR
jgi:hypothetical protein